MVTTIDDQMHQGDYDQPARLYPARSSTSSITNDGTISTGTKRPKEVSPCYVCGATAHGYNFDQSMEIVQIKNNVVFLKFFGI